MDNITLSKVLTHLAYPGGLIAILTLLALLYLLFGKRTRSYLSLLCACILFLAASNPVLSTLLVRQLENQYPQMPMSEIPKADAIVVLGGSLRPPSPPRRFSQLSSNSDRFWYAVKLFKANKAPKILLTGGNVFSNKEIQSEAFYIKKILLELGIPNDAILIEEDSKTTAENAVNSQQKFAQHNINSALLVTSAMHMPRAVELFKKTGINIIPSSSDIHVTESTQPETLRWIPSARAFTLTTLAAHEYYGAWFYRSKVVANNLLSKLQQELK